MSFQGVNTNKLNGGLNRSNPSTDGVVMLLFAIPLASLPAGVEHGEPIEMYQLKDAEDIGINAALDANANILAHNAISEFFRVAPESVLYFVPVAAAISPLAILQLASTKKAIRDCKDVKGLAIGGTTEAVAALDAMVTAIQGEINNFAIEKRLLDFVILQGNGETEPVAVSAYLNLRERTAPNVSVSIAQDPAVAAKDVAYAKYADVGTVLGMLAVRKVNENLGSVDIITKPRIKRGTENYTLSGLSEWLGASLSDGKAFSTLSQTDHETLTTKGYIYAGSFEGYDGVYFNDSPTCVEESSDYANIENNRVWNKAARAIRAALLPKVRGVVKKDPSTGYIRSTTISVWEQLVKKALGGIEAQDEISGYDCYINPKQILSATTPLIISATVVADGIVHEFDVDLGLAASV